MAFFDIKPAVGITVEAAEGWCIVSGYQRIFHGS